MNIPDQIRIRILFRIEENEYRKFYWFEMKDNEMYWGESSDGQHYITPFQSDGKNDVRVEIPKKFNEFEKEFLKFSFHKSGQIHTTTTSRKPYEKLSVWCNKETIKEPRRFFVITTKAIKNYPLFTKKNFSDKKTKALILSVPPKFLENRLYIEFYLSPLGQFKSKPTLFYKNVRLNYFYHVLNKDLMLVGVYSIIDIRDEVGRDLEISFIPTDI